MRTIFFLLLLALSVACGASEAQATAPEQGFNPIGLKLVIGVDRTRTIEVQPDGGIVSSDSGTRILSFVGSEMRTPDGSKAILSLQDNDLRGPEKSLGTFDGTKLNIGDIAFWIEDDGVVRLERNGNARKMRMHFDGPVAGKKRPALMLVAFVFSLYVAKNPSASIDQFVD